MTSQNTLEHCAGIVLDVAGTVTPLTFVEGTLLPFAIKHAEDYLKSNWESEKVQTITKELLADDKDLTVEKAFEKFKKLTEEKSEDASVKSLQGLIYKKGYESGDLKAEVFADVKEALSTWSKTKKVAVYSTGSVESQKLFFAHTDSGSLSEFIANYFDQTNIGVKTEKASFEKIAKELSLTPEEIVFISDSVAENKAAKEAGCVGVLALREGNPELSEEDKSQFICAKSFAELQFSAKRKNDETDAAEVTEAPPAKVAKTEEKPVVDNVMEVESADKKTEEEAKKADEPVEEKMETDAEPPTLETEEVKEKETALVEEKEVIDAKVEKEIAEKVEAEKTEEPKTDEEKPVETPATSEIVKLSEEQKVETESSEVPAESAKVEEKVETAEEATESKDSVDTATEATEESKPAEEVIEKAEEAKETEVEDKTKTNEKTEEKVNGSEVANGKTEETGESKAENGSATTEEEKENTSETANVVANGAEKTEKEKELTVEEIKAKKIEEPAEVVAEATTPISVEV